MMRQDPSRGIDRDGYDLVGRIMGDFFDVHPAFGRYNKSDTRCPAIEQHREIEFLFDVAAVLDIQAVYPLSCGARLRCYKCGGEDFPGLSGHFVHCFWKAVPRPCTRPTFP